MNKEKIKEDFSRLCSEGDRLLCSLVLENSEGVNKEKFVKQIKKKDFKIEELPSFRREYEQWYTKAVAVIKTFSPHRVQDFISLYKNDKRKQLDGLTYTICDAVAGVANKSRNLSPIIAAPLFSQQISILEGASNLVDSVFYDTENMLRADLFDSEIDSAYGLLKLRFLRAAGAICGVVLEKHLRQICNNHNIAIKKKSPCISDYNDELKNSGILDMSTWRNIQYLGDLRNLCDHDKTVEPTKEQVKDLCDGTKKIISTVY